MPITNGIGSVSESISQIVSRNSQDVNKHLERLASGNRITQASDDAAGLAVSDKLAAEVRSMTQAERNANDGVSFSQVAEGGLTEMSSMLVRLRELAIQASSDTIGDRDREIIQKEVQGIVQEVDRIANVTNFNGVSLLNGKASKSKLEFQVGTGNTSNDRIAFDTSTLDVRADNLGIDGLNFTSQSGARDGIERIDEGLTKLAGARATMGSIQNQLQSSVRTLDVVRENVQEARSRVADVDIALEASALAKDRIREAAGIAVLAQANSMAGLVVKLVG